MLEASVRGLLKLNSRRAIINNEVLDRSTSNLLRCLGKNYLRVITPDNFLFVIRPTIYDILWASLGAEYYELNKWFLPNAKGVVVDVGAHLGEYSIRASRTADLVIAIEPEKENFALLRINSKLNSVGNKVVLVNKAIGGSKGIAKLKLPQGISFNLGGFSIVKFSGYSGEALEEVVEMDTLDNIISSFDVDRVNLLKVDIEGAEGIAYKGMIETLKRSDKIMIEIWPENEWLVSKLRELGFRLVDRRERNFFFVRKVC